MSISTEYREIYNNEIRKIFGEEISIYNKEKGMHIYQPLSHNCSNKCKSGCNHDCYKSLGSLMRKNIIFYCYGEEEVVNRYRKGKFDDLEKAIKIAYGQRLPHRNSDHDGLPGEVLLDAIIQSVIPNAYKMAVRTIFRQNDNNEIKGYDLTYFTNYKGKITLWLGQAKLGDRQYCKEGILADLRDKYDKIYMAKQIYFLADKPVELTSEGKEIAEMLCELNDLNINDNEISRAEKLIDFLIEKNIDINIPCLLAYEKKSVYGDVDYIKISNEIVWIKKFFDKEFSFMNIEPNIIFIIFPMDDIKSLRGDRGFYEGLC